MITFAEILLEVRKYVDSKIELDMIKKAYQIAEEAHRGVKRESGEPYITHPLEVAKILITMRQDVESICAGLLHDVIEDTDITKEMLETKLLGNDDCKMKADMCRSIGNLVDGVTKVKKENYDIKILKEMCKDERIIMIKLADRLHNMRTIGGKKDPAKRKKTALKTFNVFVPLAKNIGAYKIKYELEDLCFREIAPETYQKLLHFQEEVGKCAACEIRYLKQEIEDIFPDKELYFYPKVKDIYGIYKFGYPPLEDGQKKEITEELLNKKEVVERLTHNFRKIPELIQLKIIVPDSEDCYEIAEKIFEIPLADIDFTTVRDYIENPKKNMYQSYDMVRNFMLIPVQYQVRTEQMDLINCYGPLSLATSYDGSNFLQRIQKSILQCRDDKEIMEQFVSLTSKKICVFDQYDNSYEIDPGNTIIDLFYKMNGQDPKEITGAFVNGKAVRKNYILKNGDSVYISTKKLLSALDLQYQIKK